MKYVKAKEAAGILGVHGRTLCRWEEEGRIEAIKTPSGQRRYNIDSYITKFGRSGKTVIYARVSGRDQQPDLNRQVASLSILYPQAEIIAEKRTPRRYAIGGGLNFKPKKLLALLERILSRDVGMVIVAHKDRLARYA